MEDNNEFKLEKENDKVKLSEIVTYNKEDFKGMYEYMVQARDFKQKQLEQNKSQQQQIEEALNNYEERIAKIEKFAEQNGIKLENDKKQ